MQAKLYAFSLFLFFALGSNAQDRKQLSLDLNRSFNGSGDMTGLGFAAEYGRYLTKRLEFTTAVGANIHPDEETVIVQPGPGSPYDKPVDASYRMVTAGLQLTGQLHYAPLRTRASELKIGAGPLLRYQSSSGSGGYSLNGPVPSSYIYLPSFSFRQTEDQNIVTAGYFVSLAYAYTFRNKLFVGTKASFQNDTNADVIAQYGLRIGKRF